MGVTGVSGVVYLVKGGPSTSSAGGQVVDNLLGTGSPTLEYFQMDSGGAVATGVGDVNNDQYDDFVIADPNNSFGASQAAVYLFLGPVSWRPTGVTGALDPLSIANASIIGDNGAAVGAQVVPSGGRQRRRYCRLRLRQWQCAADRAAQRRWSMGMTADVSLAVTPRRRTSSLRRWGM